MEGLVIFIIRVNFIRPSLGPQSSGGMNSGVKIVPLSSPKEVRGVGALTNRCESGYK